MVEKTFLISPKKTFSFHAEQIKPECEIYDKTLVSSLLIFTIADEIIEKELKYFGMEGKLYVFKRISM